MSMPVTVRRLIAVETLGLEVIAGHAGLDREVSWVHGSEVPDPTPWLTGGELLLTTGVQLAESGALRVFCGRLADSGAAGVGFGVGVAFDEVPDELCMAADECQLALMRVPYRTPFIAIAKHLSVQLAAEEHAALRSALRAQHRLLDAALSEGGVAGVLGELAGLLDGWCVLADAGLYPMAATPGSATRRLPEFHGELDRLRHGELDTVSLRGPGEHILAHRLGADPHDSRGVLLVGTNRRYGTSEHAILASAVSLLGLSLEQRRAAEQATRKARNELIVQLLHDQVEKDLAEHRLAEWGLPAHGLIVAALDGSVGTDRFVATDTVACDHNGYVFVLGQHPEPVLGAHPAGLSTPSHVGALDFARRSAIQALRIGSAEGQTIIRAGELHGLRLLLRLHEEQGLDVFVTKVLGPIGDDELLLDSLRAFLESNGSWQQAASKLAIHRHTLRSRIERAQRRLARPLDSPYTRIELGLALHARELITPEAVPRPARRGTG